MCMRWKLVSCSLTLTLALLASCGRDQAENGDPECPIGTSYNPILGECVRVATDPPGADAGGDAGDEQSPDAAEPDTSQPDAATEPDATDPNLTCTTDADGDGAISMACGGDDCDDNDPRRAPHLVELCDEVDNNCDGQVNEDLDCTILAHSSSRLYRLDIFAGTYDDLGATVPDLWDIDTHPNGTLYGIAGTKLYSYDQNAGSWNPSTGNLSSFGFGFTPNGFCIDNDGLAYLTGGNEIHSVDLATGTSTRLGSISPASSSGDCVVNKGNTLFVTSSHTDPDSFVALMVDSTVQVGTPKRTQHDAIWGLTAAWNRVFGLTFSGEVVEINDSTGQSTLVTSYPIEFFGAASTPNR